MIADEERGAVGPAEQLAIRSTVAVVVCADVVGRGVAVGALGDGAEVVVLRAGGGGDAEGEVARAVAVDAVDAAAGVAGDGEAGGCGCETEDGGEAEEEGCGMHFLVRVMWCFLGQLSRVSTEAFGK